MNPPTLVAAGIGEVGYVQFLHELLRLHVLDREDVLAHLRLHGTVLRLTGEPIDADGIDEETFAALEGDLGAA